MVVQEADQDIGGVARKRGKWCKKQSEEMGKEERRPGRRIYEQTFTTPDRMVSAKIEM